ncbi:hypothetical protein CW304_04835 [Bacillus sp. UFRGS-B20]|nr:hypothetical protein CW304_04835 [Bacillus sp. UFRGS-B20]
MFISIIKASPCFLHHQNNKDIAFRIGIICSRRYQLVNARQHLNQCTTHNKSTLWSLERFFEIFDLGLRILIQFNFLDQLQAQFFLSSNKSSAK